jgi:hypothetical protein
MTGNKIFTTSAKRSLVYKSPSLPALGGTKHLYSNERSDSLTKTKHQMKQTYSDIREEHDSQLSTKNNEPDPLLTSPDPLDGNRDKSVFSTWHNNHTKNKVSAFIQHATGEGARVYLNEASDEQLRSSLAAS